MRTKILATLSVGVLLAGCQLPDPRGNLDKSMAAQSPELVCAGFVDTPGTPTFDACVAFQKTRDPGQSVPPFRKDQYNNRVDAQGYAVDGTGRRMPVQSPYPTPPNMDSLVQ